MNFPAGKPGVDLQWMNAHFNRNSSVIPPFDWNSSPLPAQTAYSSPYFLQTEQIAQLRFLSLSSSTLSIMACVSVISTFWSWRAFRTPANRLIYFMSVADLGSAVAIFLGGQVL
jgi:hypothetical protein